MTENPEYAVHCMFSYRPRILIYKAIFGTLSTCHFMTFMNAFKQRQTIKKNCDRQEKKPVCFFKKKTNGRHEKNSRAQSAKGKAIKSISLLHNLYYIIIDS